MNMKTLLIIISTSMVLPYQTYSLVQNEFQYPPQWDNSVQECLDGLTREMPSCGNYVLDHHFKIHLESAVKSGNEVLKTIVRKLCISYQTEGRGCLDKYIIWLTPCLNKTDLHKEQRRIHMAHNNWQYVCSEDGNNALALFSPTTVQCVQHRSYGIQQCLKPLHLNSMKYVMDTLGHLLVIGECVIFNKTTACILHELHQCQDQTAAIIMEGDFTHLLRESPCSQTTAYKQHSIKQNNFISQEEIHLNIEDISPTLSIHPVNKNNEFIVEVYSIKNSNYVNDNNTQEPSSELKTSQEQHSSDQMTTQKYLENEVDENISQYFFPIEEQIPVNSSTEHQSKDQNESNYYTSDELPFGSIILDTEHTPYLNEELKTESDTDDANSIKENINSAEHSNIEENTPVAINSVDNKDSCKCEVKMPKVILQLKAALNRIEAISKEQVMEDKRHVTLTYKSVENITSTIHQVLDNIENHILSENEELNQITE